MKYEEFTYKSANGTDTVVADLWLPDTDTPQGILQITHGMCEHMGRYKGFAEYMCANGFVVTGQDHIGHGRTAATESDLGFFAEKDGDKHLVEDVHGLRLIIQSKFPNIPYFLFGHSMGSFITRQYVSIHGQGLAGYICCGTGGPNPTLGPGVIAARLACLTAGSHARGYSLNKLAFGAAYKPARIYAPPTTGGGAIEIKPDSHPHVSRSWLSRDPEVWTRIATDKKCNYVFTNSGFKDLFTLYHGVSKPSWAHRVPKELPILVIAGEKDPVGEKGKGVTTVYNRLKQAGIKDITLKLYPDARHEILNELNKEEVMKDILAWVMLKFI